MALPYPRLELRWRRTTEEVDGDLDPELWPWACDYVLVIHRATVGDCRSNKGDRYAAQPVHYVLNTTYRDCSHDPYPGDIPYRDGAHSEWDSIALDIPAYWVYKGRTKRLKPSDNSVRVVRERMDGTDTGLIKNRRRGAGAS